MADYYLRTGQLMSQEVSGRANLLVEVPGALERRVVLANAEQLHLLYRPQMYCYRLLMMLGNSKIAAQQLAPVLFPKVKALADEVHELQSQFEMLKGEVAEFNAGQSSRAQLFLNIFDRGKGKGDVGYKVSGGKPLSSDELDAFVKRVYAVLSFESGATERVKKGVREYIHTGSLAQDTLVFLAAAGGNAFQKLQQYSQLERLLVKAGAMPDAAQQTSSSQNSYSSLEEQLVPLLAAIKSGEKSPSDVELNRIKINISKELQQILGEALGVAPLECFVCTIAEVVEGRNNKGVFVPLLCRKPDGSDLPEALRQHYMPMETFVKVVAALDKTFQNITNAYVLADTELKEAVAAKMHVGLVVRNIMPQNAITDMLYPDNVMCVRDKPELTDAVVARVRACMKSGRVVELASGSLGLREEKISPAAFERIAELLSQLMPLVPLEFYYYKEIAKDAAAVYSEFKRAGEEISRVTIPLRSDYQARVIEAKRSDKARTFEEKHREAEEVGRVLREQFGISGERFVYDDKVTIDEVIRLFGEKFRFVEHVLRTAAQHKPATS